MSDVEYQTYGLSYDDPFESILIKMAAVHRRKSQDYTGGGEADSLQNFIDSAYQLSLTPGEAIELLISTKQARLRVLLPNHLSKTGKPANEGIEDTLLDRAVYSVIALEAWDGGQYENESLPHLERVEP